MLTTYEQENQMIAFFDILSEKDKRCYAAIETLQPLRGQELNKQTAKL